MFAMDLIKPVQTESALPILFVPKNDGTFRFCVDYCKLCAVPVQDSNPIPRQYECMDSLGDARTFSTLGANCSYWPMEVASEESEKTAFAPISDYFELGMPFAVWSKKPPRTFQELISYYPSINGRFLSFISMISSGFLSPHTNASTTCKKSWRYWTMLGNREVNEMQALY